MNDLIRPVTVRVSDEIRVHGRNGRPRTRGINPWSHYAGSEDGKSRPRCKAPGCDKFLRVTQVATCSDECRRKLRLHATILLESCEHDEKTADAETLERTGRIDPL